MTKRYFAELLRDEIVESYPHSVINEVPKGYEIKTAIVIKKNENDGICPNIYIDEMYDGLSSVPRFEMHSYIIDCGKKIIEIAESAFLDKNINNEKIKVLNIANKEHILANTVCVLYNGEAFKSVHPNALCTDYLDMTIGYRYLVDINEDGMSSFLISDSYIEKYGITKDELHEAALHNTDVLFGVDVKPLSQKMNELMGGMMDMSDIPVLDAKEELWVLSNKINMNGASALLNKDNLDKICDSVGTDVYVLPSSIHEVLCMSVNNSNLSLTELREMVEDINRATVPLSERLSNNVFKYNCNERKLEQVTVSKLDIRGQHIDSVPRKNKFL